MLLGLAIWLVGGFLFALAFGQFARAGMGDDPDEAYIPPGQDSKK